MKRILIDVQFIKFNPPTPLMKKHTGELLSPSSSSLDKNIKLTDLLDPRLSLFLFQKWDFHVCFLKRSATHKATDEFIGRNKTPMQKSLHEISILELGN